MKLICGITNLMICVGGIIDWIVGIGSNDSGQMGFPLSVQNSDEFIQVTEIKNCTPTESELILNRINCIAVGRSHSLFASKYFHNIHQHLPFSNNVTII